MFGGKRLKDLTEEEIRQYAASLASGVSASSAAAPPGEAEPPSAGEVEPSTAGDAEPGGSEVRTASPREELEREVELAGRQLELDRRGQEEEEARQRQRQGELEAERQKRLEEEERYRMEVLSELDRSQMPAVRTSEGLLQKTIEHYTFADAEDVATIYIDLDRDLFDGAAALMAEEAIEVVARDSEVTILLRGLLASKTVAAPAEWKLYIGPLFHSIEPEQTKRRLRKGRVSVKLVKRKKQEWRRLVKF